MQTADLVKYINDPHLLDKQSIGELQKLAADFPYFQPAHMLLSMASRKWDASVYQQSLKRTAIVVTNREHLFNLIHAIENAEVQVTEKPAVEAKEQIVTPVKEEIKETLAPAIPEPVVLKQPKEVAEIPVTETVEAPVVEEIKPVVELKPAISPEEALEKEIEKQVVNSFVEKELLKTPELHHPKPVIEPENFVEWLSLLKKNNGTPLRQSETRVTEEASTGSASNSTGSAFKPKAKEEPKQEEEKITAAAQTPDQQKKQQKHRAIIDRIIENSPGLIRTKEEQKFFTPDIKAKESLLENEHLVTETLAKIYALQGNVNKAVRAYEILSLKFPQKSAYFATLIKNLKNNQ